MTTIAQYSCPLCYLPMAQIDKQLICDNNHSFDFAKEGYINLLPVQHKKSLSPGDDKNMVLARREFLSSGHYQFLRDALVSILQDTAPDVLVDLGCGEGYYTNEIDNKLPIHVYGVDISKSAVKYAAKRNKNVNYSVATISQLPFPDKMANVILNIFAPLSADECRRILTKDGTIVRVSPGPRHLWQLKEFIYGTPEVHDSPTSLEGFSVIQQITINEKKVLNGSMIKSLLTMTPFGWKITEQKLETLLQQEPLEIEFEFLIEIHQ